MPEQLKIIIDAEVNGAVRGMKALQGGIANLKKTTVDFVSTLKGSFDPAVFKSFVGGTANITQMRLALETLKENMRNTSDPRQLVKYNLAIKDIEGNLKKAAVAGTQFGGAAGQVFSSLTQSAFSLARILPGIGIAGIIGLASDALIGLVSSLFETNKEIDRHADVIAGASKEYAGAIASVNELKINIQLAKEGFIKKDAVVKQYNESIGKTTGFVKTLDEAEKELGKNADAYVKFTLLKAAANFALEEASKKAVKAALIPQEDIKKNLNFFQRLNLPFEKAPSRKTQEQKFLKPVIDQVIKEEEDLEKIANDFQRKAAEIAKKFGFNFFEKTLPKAETDDTLSRARQFVKEFGDVFVLPNLDETFFRGVKQLLPEAKKLLAQIKIGDLKIKIPVQTDFQLLPEPQPLSKEQLEDLTNRFFADIKGVPVDIVIDPSLSINNIKLIEEKLKLKQQFNIFGDLGVKAFGKIDFSNLTNGIKEATKLFGEMKLVADTVASSLSQGLTGAFDAVFDSILDGKSVFMALGESIKALVVDMIKAIAKMLIIKAVTNLIFPGGGGLISGLGRSAADALGGISNGGFGLGGQLSGRSFNNTLNVVVQGQISGQTILLAGQRAANSNSRFGG